MNDLAGITVVSLEQAVAAPYVSGRLAEAGARVIKIERAEGDFARHYDSLVLGQSAYFVWLNAGKESVVLDLRQPQDKQLLDAMLAQADIFIQNLAPGALQRLGFDPERLQEQHPELIICSISGYGETGPYRDQKAYDLLIQAETGLCSVTGVGEELTRVGVSVSDIAAGMTAYQEILQALFTRERDPQRAGRHINVSLFHATADWMNVPYLQHRYGDFTPANHGLKHPSIAPYGAFACGDNKAVLISIQNDVEWRNLCRDVLDDMAMADDPRFVSNQSRVEHRQALDALISDVFYRHTREQIIEKLNAARIAFGRLSDLGDLAQHPQNRYRDVDTANGRVVMLGRGAQIVERQADDALQASKLPEVGEHTASVRAEFGV
ncbi:MAG: crotonobetainyl-CoA:carnitine CoA-transferase CaiB-like acyl-CoA transferase [Candidatus Azotimanducaceae bacterium]|jgi:crotonobetainyl-CoA:carnitine CoA-transferase CaiB-like acyl-CoA transferase